MPGSLSIADVERLLADPSPQTRANTAAKIADQFTSGGLADAESRITEDIFRALVRDIDLQVREALSNHLKTASDLPRDVALKLASDVDSVALPMLRSSEVLTDEDLIDIVGQSDTNKQAAIAQRDSVSSDLADALIDTGNEKVVARLVANEGAEIRDAAYEKVMRAHADSESVQSSLSSRSNLPAAVSERVMTLLTDRLHDYLTRKCDLSLDLASTLILQARERATVDLISGSAGGQDLDGMVDALAKSERLTPSLMLRTLCFGDLAFFETAMARLARVPLDSARLLIHDEGALGLKSIYRKAGLPDRLLPAFRAALSVRSDTDYDGRANDRQRLIARMLERMLTYFENDEGLAEDDKQYLINKLEQLAA